MGRLNPVWIVVIVVVAVVAIGFALVKKNTPEAKPGMKPREEAGQSERGMGRVAPVVNAASPAAANALVRGGRTLDEAAEKQNQAVDDLFGAEKKTPAE